jgi:hypothetical protein
MSVSIPKKLLSVFRIQSVLATLLLFSTIYVVHAYLRHQHYTHCTSNIFRVVLLQKSSMCEQLDSILHGIESVCSTNVLNMMAMGGAYLSSYKALFT